MNDLRADHIGLPFGEGSVEVPRPPGTLHLLGGRYPEPIADLPARIERVLESPTGCGSLGSLVPSAGSIVVLVGDPTRGRTTIPVLEQVLGYLARRGAGPERTAIVIATGMHRSLHAGETERHLGASARGYRIIEHDARDASRLVDRGTTAAGTPCSFLREAAEAALVVGIGTVSFHDFAGFGGGRKMILPGIAGERTILANHRLSLGAGPEHRSLAPGCGPAAVRDPLRRCRPGSSVPRSMRAAEALRRVPGTPGSWPPQARP